LADAGAVAEAACQTRDGQRQRAELGRHLHATPMSKQEFSDRPSPASALLSTWHGTSGQGGLSCR
jgi:hypothetical protein